MRSKLLIENFIFFGVLKVLSSLLPFLILPIIVRYLADPKDFATYDNYTIIVSVLCSLTMMGSYDAMFREFFSREESEYRKSVVKTGLMMVLSAGLIMASISVMLREKLAELFFGDSEYSYLIWFVVISLFVQTMSRIAISPSKMQNNKKHIFYNTILYIVLFYALSLVLLELGYGFISLILGQLISFGVCLVVFGIINREYFFKGKFDFNIVPNLLKIGLPLVPIFIIYWANNAIVRIFIVDQLGTDQMGIFALGSRYAAVSSLLQMAFAGGWSYFTFSTMKDSDHVAMKSKIFKYLAILIALFYYVIGLVYEPFFDYTFAEDYSGASAVFPSLFLAPLLLVLFQIIANQFIIIGKSYISLFALALGLIFNIAVGYYGAAVFHDLKLTSASIPIGYLIAVGGTMMLGIRHKVINIDAITVFNLVGVFVLFILLYLNGPLMRLYTTLVISLIMYFNRHLMMESIHIVKNLVQSMLRKSN